MSALPDSSVVDIAQALRRAARVKRDGFYFEGDVTDRHGATLCQTDPDGPTFWDACQALHDVEILAAVAINELADEGHYDEALLLAWNFRHAICDGTLPEDHPVRSDPNWRNPAGIRLGRVRRTVGFKGGDLPVGDWVLVLPDERVPQFPDHPELLIRAFAAGVSCDSIVYEADVEIVR